MHKSRLKHPHQRSIKQYGRNASQIGSPRASRVSHLVISSQVEEESRLVRSVRIICFGTAVGSFRCPSRETERADDSRRILSWASSAESKKMLRWPIWYRAPLPRVQENDIELHYFGGWLFFCSKMCVLCMFYVHWELEGQKQLEGRDFFEYKLVRLGLQGSKLLFSRP